MDATSESALHPRLRLAHYPSGYAFGYDPTGRCDKKEFLLKFGRDRHRYLQWLFEAKKRFGLSVLNYVVTSNHVHLLVKNNGERDVIPNSIQLIAGRTGQGFNQRKPFSGYNEIQRPRERYAIVDYEELGESVASGTLFNNLIDGEALAKKLEICLAGVGFSLERGASVAKDSKCSLEG